MSFYESFKKVVTKTAKDAAKASGELVEQTKLKLKAVEVKGDIESAFAKIGSLYYDMAELEVDNSEEILALVEEVKSNKALLIDIEEEISRSKKKD